MALKNYAWVLNGVIQRYQIFEEGEQPIYEAVEKGVWLPVVTTESPTFDPDIQSLEGSTVIGASEVTISHTVVPLDPEVIRESLQAKRRRKFTETIQAGYPAGNGKFVQINDGSRANLSGMALTALMALNNLAPWPVEYSEGWVTEDGSRIPLPTPQDGIALAAAAGTYYAATVQADQNLENEINAAAANGTPWPEF